MVHVRFVERFVAVERSVFLHEIDNWDVARAVSRTELAVRVLEYRDDRMVLVDEQTDVVLLDAAVQADGDACESLRFVFLDQVLNFGEVLLAVRALGAEIVNEQRAVAEMAEQNARIADAGKVLGKVHDHRLVSRRIHHQLDVCDLRFRCELGKARCCDNGYQTQNAKNHIKAPQI